MERHFKSKTKANFPNIPINISKFLSKIYLEK